MCEFTWCPFGGNGTSEILFLIKKTLENDCTLSPYDLPPTTKRFKGLHTDTVLENDLLPTAMRFKFSDECQMRELAEGLQPKNTANS